MSDATSKVTYRARHRRHSRIRVKLGGTTQRPRLNVFRSLSHIYAQVIDDERGITVAQASTIDKEIAPLVQGKTKVEASKIVGQKVAERAKQAGVEMVVFDRGGYKYHGRVAALAEGAREAGLQF